VFTGIKTESSLRLPLNQIFQFESLEFCGYGYVKKTNEGYLVHIIIPERESIKGWTARLSTPLFLDNGRILAVPAEKQAQLLLSGTL
jgi:hypothetical protein